jgi:hypothetical protein
MQPDFFKQCLILLSDNYFRTRGNSFTLNFQDISSGG